MAKFYINPPILHTVSENENAEYQRIFALADEIEDIKKNLLFSIAGAQQIKTRLNTAAENSRDNGNVLKQMSSVTSKIADLYSRTELEIYANAGGKSVAANITGMTDAIVKKYNKEENSKKSFGDYLKEFIVDAVGEMGTGGKITSKVLKYLTGANAGKGKANWLDAIKDVATVGGSIASFIGKSKADQTLAAFFGAAEQKSFIEGIKDGLKKFKFVDADDAAKLTGAKVVAKNVATVAKWAGTAVTFITEGIENYEENKNSSDKLRWVKEAIGETGVNIAEDILIGAAIGSVVPGAGTVIGAAVAAVGTVGAKWIVNKGFNALTGQKFDEFVSDVVIDFSNKDYGAVAKTVGDAVATSVHNIGEGVKNVGKGISALWNNVTGWGQKAYA